MPNAATPSPFLSFLPLIFIFGIFYLLVLRPQQQQQKKHAEALSRLQKGDQVVTSGGVHGLVAGLKDQTLLLKIADNVKIELSRTAITTIKKKADSD